MSSAVVGGQQAPCAGPRPGARRVSALPTATIVLAPRLRSSGVGGASRRSRGAPTSRWPITAGAAATGASDGFTQPEAGLADLYDVERLPAPRAGPVPRAVCLLGGAVLGLAAGLHSSSRYQQVAAAMAAHQQSVVTSASCSVGATGGGTGGRDGFLTGYNTPISDISGDPVVYPALHVVRPAEQRTPVVLVSCERSIEGGATAAAPPAEGAAPGPVWASIALPAVVATHKTVAPPGVVPAVAGEGGAVTGRCSSGTRGEGLIFVGASDDGRAAARQSVQNQKFKAFLSQVEDEATKQGVHRHVVRRELGRLKAPVLQVIQADRNQPEKKQTLGDYVGVRVEPRLAPGREAMADERGVLEEVQAKWGVPSEVLVAIWGIESNFGSFMGKWPTCQALATLAFDSTSADRGDYFRSELIAALQLIDEGKVKGGADMQGSWAGAMGQCQFMPSNFQRFAVDHDGDGRADIWGSRPDVLASMANFLSHNGWKRGQPYGRAAKAPANISIKEVGLGKERTVEEWLRKGVTLVGDGPPLPPKSMASLIAPDGANGPAFLAGPNFRTIMRYNPSTWYAVAVGSLANGIFTARA